MNLSNKSLSIVTTQPGKHNLSYNVVSMVGSLLLLFDIISLLLTAVFSTLLYTYWLAPLSSVTDLGNNVEQAAFVAAVLAPFILYDKRFGSIASRGHMSALVCSFILRFTLFAAVVLALGGAIQVLNNFPNGWLVLWFATSLLLTSVTRLLAAQYVRRLQHQGVLIEVIAVVGCGPVANRLMHTLRQTRPETIELLGIFDDKTVGVEHNTTKPMGTIAQLIELGKTRKIDWILLTLPPTEEQKILSIVQRLKALSVSIGLCPQYMGLSLPHHPINYVGDSVPVSLLAEQPIKLWDTVVKVGEDFLPRWMITLTLLPLVTIKMLVDNLIKHMHLKPQKHTPKLTFQFDNYDLEKFTDVAAGFGQNRYGYVVTPNADHLIRLDENPSFRALYAAASYILLDSRFLSRLLHITKGIQLPVCTGSDLTAKLFSEVITPEDPLVLIGGSHTQAQRLRERYDLRGLMHYNPPMGFIHDPEAVEMCLHFIETHSPFRFCLLAVGAPQQEAIAQQLKARGNARGLALCIGASINFLTGEERRAPLWMQHCGIEWFFRLMQAPGRMAKRYLVRGPRVFGLLRHSEIVLRKVSVPILQLVPTSDQPALPTATSSSEPAHFDHAERKNRLVNTSI